LAKEIAREDRLLEHGRHPHQGKTHHPPSHVKNAKEIKNEIDEEENSDEAVEEEDAEEAEEEEAWEEAIEHEEVEIPAPPTHPHHPKKVK
jgi:hypothetical protein